MHTFFTTKKSTAAWKIINMLVVFSLVLSYATPLATVARAEDTVEATVSDSKTESDITSDIETKKDEVSDTNESSDEKTDSDVKEDQSSEVEIKIDETTEDDTVSTDDEQSNSEENDTSLIGEVLQAITEAIRVPQTGSIWTTTGSCGAPQNVNHYDVGEDVYINGANFSAGPYDWDITGNPGGSSADPNIAVAMGKHDVDASGVFCFKAYTIEEDDDGLYKAGFGTKKSDNYSVNNGTTTTTDGSIRVCKVIVDENGAVMTSGFPAGSNFSIEGNGANSDSFGAPAGTIPTTNLDSELTLNADLFGNVAGNDAECTTYDDLSTAKPGFYYKAEGMSNTTDWDDPKYNDQYGLPGFPAGSNFNLNKFHEFSEELFDGSAANDGSRNQQADGHITLRSYPERTLIVVNTYTGEGQQCEIESVTVVSDTTATVVGGGNAVATYVHPAWTDDIAGATWIWSDALVTDPSNPQTKTFEKTFTVDGEVLVSSFDIAADNNFKVWINGNLIADDSTGPNHGDADITNISGINPAYFNDGSNTLKVEVTNLGGGTTPQDNPAGVLFKLTLRTEDCDPNDPGDPTEDDGSIRVCKAIVDESGNRNPAGIPAGVTFTIPWLTNSDYGADKVLADLPDAVFTTPLTLNADLYKADGSFGTDGVNDVQCITYNDLEFSGAPREGYYYGAETISNPSGWGTPKINDQWKENIASFVTPYINNNFDGDMTNNDNHDQRPDGLITLSDATDWNSNRTLIVVNTLEDDGGQCIEGIMARVVITSFSNLNGGGNASSDVFVGGPDASDKYASGEWFQIHDGTNWVNDPAYGTWGVDFLDVPGLIVRRMDGKLQIRDVGPYLNGNPKPQEHIEGYIEFMNATVASQTNDGIVSNISMDNATNGTMEIKDTNDEMWIDGGKSYFWMTTSTGSDGFFTNITGPITTDCDENPFCGDFNVDQGEECDAGPNGSSTCSSTCETIDQCVDTTLTIVSDDSSVVVENGNAAAVEFVSLNSGWTASIPGATWIWEALTVDDPTAQDTKTFNKSFVIDGAAASATLDIAADNYYTVKLNGNTIATVNDEFNYTAGGQDTYTFNATQLGYFNDGNNTLSIEVTNMALAGGTQDNNPAGLLYKLVINTDCDGGNGGGPICGNGVVEQGEQCDGGPNCSSTCQTTGSTSCDVNINLIANAGFESPIADDNGGMWEMFPTGTSGLDWIAEFVSGALNPTVELQNTSLFASHGGSQHAELDGSQSTRIYQDAITVPGETYELSYWFSPLPGQAENTVVAKVEGNTVATTSADGTGLNTTAWQEVTYSFTATDTSTRISFENSDTSNGFGTLLDDVRLSCTDDNGNGGNGPFLTVVKVVSGGDAQVSDFPLFVGGTSVTSGVKNSFTAGVYQVSETNNNSSYSATFSGDCDASGLVTLSGSDDKTCTITNTFDGQGGDGDGDDNNGGGGGGGGGSSRRSSSNDNDDDEDDGVGGGEVLGATLAATGFDISMLSILLGLSVVLLVLARRREDRKI